MATVKSKYQTPNAVTGGYDDNHFETELAQLVDANTAAAHNALFRGKDLTAYFNSGEMSQAIANGSFKDIFPGDFIIKTTVVDGVTYTNQKYIVGDLDYHLHCGDAETTAHHVLMFAAKGMGTARMNPENKTEGGFLGSEMWGTTLPKYTTGIKNAFGATHILNHKELLSNSESDDLPSMAGAGRNGASNNWAWTPVDVNLFNEPMVYGGKVLSSSFFDVGECKSQVAAFRHCHGLQICGAMEGARAWSWLRAVTDSSSFAGVNNHGTATSYYASHAGGAVRPYFLLR